MKTLCKLYRGGLDRPKVHFEAPPSNTMEKEMGQFITWFNEVHDSEGKLKMSPLAKAGIAHLYFVCIHPFEDGNGRIGRVYSRKTIGIEYWAANTFNVISYIEANKNRILRCFRK